MKTIVDLRNTDTGKARWLEVDGYCAMIDGQHGVRTGDEKNDLDCLIYDAEHEREMAREITEEEADEAMRSGDAIRVNCTESEN